MRSPPLSCGRSGNPSAYSAASARGSALSFRYLAGGNLYSRLKARLKAASDSEAADEPGARASPAHVQQFQASFEYAWKSRAGVDGSHARTAAEQVAVPVWQRHNVSGGQRDALAVVQLDVRPAFAEQVVDDDVTVPLREHRPEHPGLGDERHHGSDSSALK